VTSATWAPYDGHNGAVDRTKYARLEDEQRFVLPALPDGSHAPRLIEDRYVLGTRLRVRTVTDEVSRGVVAKLGHKVRLDDAHPSAVWHTTMYVDDDELAVLAALRAATLTKRRWTVAGGAVDTFLGDLDGLVLFEGPRPVVAPGPAVEVTDDERFCGGALAALDPDGAAALLAEASRLLA
jgi:CYTH domain-containing protein